MFKNISFIIGAIALAKAAAGLLLPDIFYLWRKNQYDSVSIPAVVLVMPSLFFLLAGAAWYATIVAYQPAGWVVTSFTTLIALLGTLNLMRWSSHRKKTGHAIEKEPGTRTNVDITILVLGIIFVGLAVFVY